MWQSVTGKMPSECLIWVYHKKWKYRKIYMQIIFIFPIDSQIFSNIFVLNLLYSSQKEMYKHCVLHYPLCPVRGALSLFTQHPPYMLRLKGQREKEINISTCLPKAQDLPAKLLWSKETLKKTPVQIITLLYGHTIVSIFTLYVHNNYTVCN